MSDPLISVIMPVRNGGAFLEAAVRSILAQHYPAFELILVDDASDDGAVEALPGSCLDDRRLAVVRGDGGGVVAAMRLGAARAGGELIARMDADDIALPDRLARQAAYLAARPEVGIAGGQVSVFRAGGVGGGFSVYQRWINALCEPRDIAHQIYIESPLPNPTAMFRREVYERLGGYRDSEWAEDYDLVLRAHAAGIAMGKPHGVVLHWRDHDGRLTRTDPRYGQSRFMEASGHHLARGPLRARAAVIWGAGRCGGRLHDILCANGARVRGFIDIHPRRIGGRKRGLPVWPVSAVEDVGEALVVGAVRSRGARELIRRHLESIDRREGHDFLFAA